METFSKIDPAIKWSGSKRSQATDITSWFPSKINTYYEPFVGGASVTYRLIERIEKGEIKVGQILCTDLNADLIQTWNLVKCAPHDLHRHYTHLWMELTQDDNIDRKRDYFNMVRDRYNKERNPADFFFIMRTTANGMPRYNSAGEFNNAFHITRNGIEPARLWPILEDWSEKLKAHQVIFLDMDYHNITPSEGDFVYADPPYAGTKGMYYGGFDNAEFLRWMGTLPCDYAFSFNGIAGKENHTVDVPVSLYDAHLYLESGNSSWRRVMQVSSDTVVRESLYIKGCSEHLVPQG